MSEQREQEVLTTRTAEELEGARSLGSGSTKYVYTYDPELLETFVNKHPDNDYVITFDCTEGTSLCPKTHQPDFFKAVISSVMHDPQVFFLVCYLYDNSAPSFLDV